MAHPELSLHIFGQGPELKSLCKLISDERLEGNIHLEGYTHDAPDEFERSSFSMLTSSSEGFGLVILESMSRGCIPICYDVDYGPSEIILDSINGYLVPAHDEKALVATIERFMMLAPEQKEAMRTAAITRAQEFSDDAIVPRWVSLFKKVARWKTGNDAQHPNTAGQS